MLRNKGRSVFQNARAVRYDVSLDNSKTLVLSLLADSVHLDGSPGREIAPVTLKNSMLVTRFHQIIFRAHLIRLSIH